MNYLEYRNGSFYWNLLFIKEVHNWELESMAYLLEDFYATKLHHGGVDCLVWIPSKSKDLQVKSYYKVLRGEGKYFPWLNIWRVCVPSKVAFFFWCVTLDKTLTTNNLPK